MPGNKCMPDLVRDVANEYLLQSKKIQFRHGKHMEYAARYDYSSN